MRQEAERYMGEVSNRYPNSEFEGRIQNLVVDSTNDANSQLTKLTKRFHRTILLYSMIVGVSIVSWGSFRYRDQRDWKLVERVARGTSVNPSEVIAAHEKYLAAHPMGRWVNEVKQQRTEIGRAHV